jgi:hypothetical protein
LLVCLRAGLVHHRCTQLTDLTRHPYKPVCFQYEPFYLPTYLPTYLSTCVLPYCLPAHLPTCLPACLPTLITFCVHVLDGC